MRSGKLMRLLLMGMASVTSLGIGRLRIMLGGVLKKTIMLLLLML
jgi:hypothetical protein